LASAFIGKARASDVRHPNLDGAQTSPPQPIPMLLYPFGYPRHLDLPYCYM
jgi:hypothetical protein